MNRADTGQEDRRFLEWLRDWCSNRPVARIADPERSAVVVVDMVNGFCKTGNLASERVGSLIGPVVDVLKRADRAGVSRFLVAEDTHRPDDKEFSAFPPHCVRGSGEEKTVEEIASLPFAGKFRFFSKPSLDLTVCTDAGDQIRGWIEDGVSAFVVVGDCTDLCVYQAASHTRMTTNALNRDARVIVPQRAVDTYDLSVEEGAALGALPHPGELLHRVFQYHLALLGCEVVSDVEWSTE